MDGNRATGGAASIAAVVVAYNCQTSELVHNTKSYVDHVDVMIVWDNSDDPGRQLDVEQMKRQLPPNVIYMNRGGNWGLPAAYNAALAVAAENRCTHLLTMDQDSYFADFASYKSFVAACMEDDVAVFAPPINCQGMGAPSAVECVNQSGAMFRVDVLLREGPFREDLFIGMVDAEISLRLLERGYRMVCSGVGNMLHQVGPSGQRPTARLGRMTVVLPGNSPMRHYYDTRNRVLLWHQFPYDYGLGGKCRYIAQRLKTMLKIALFESDRWKKCSAIVRGFYHGMRNDPAPYPPGRKQQKA